MVVIPPAGGRQHHTDLLLCMHHYRAARRALAAVDATVVDASGAMLADATHVAPSRPLAAAELQTVGRPES
jgi:hypothetical protein